MSKPDSEEQLDRGKSGWIMIRKVGVLSTVKIGFILGIFYLLMSIVYGVVVLSDVPDALLEHAVIIGFGLPSGAFLATIIYNLMSRFGSGIIVEVEGFNPPGPATRRCPECDEEILATRSFCPHCDVDLEPQGPNGSTDKPT